MAKVQLGISDKELKTLKGKKSSGAILRVMEQAHKQKQFNIGDVLVSYHIDPDGKQRYITLNDSDVKQKWVVIHKDEAELIYCKRVLTTGKLGVGVELICDVWGSQQFTLDPDLADHMILGDENDEFDPFATAKVLKKHKDKIKRYNESIREDTDTVIKSHEFMKKVYDKFKNGDATKVWIMRGWGDLSPEELTVTDINTVPVDTSTSKAPYWGKGMGPAIDQSLIDLGFKTKYVAKTKTDRQYGTTELKEPEISRYRMYFLQKPKTYRSDEI